MDKSLKRYTSLEAMKADEYVAWQRRPASERIHAVSELTLALYGLKGERPKRFPGFKELSSALSATHNR